MTTGIVLTNYVDVALDVNYTAWALAKGLGLEGDCRAISSHGSSCSHTCRALDALEEMWQPNEVLQGIEQLQQELVLPE